MISLGRGYQTTFATPKSSPRIFHLGTRAYDHLLILPSKLKSLGPTLTPQILLDFQKEEGNILLALSSVTATTTSLNSLLLELDISIPADRDATVVDHFNYDAQSASEDHNVLLLQHPEPRRKDVRNYFSGDGLLAFPHSLGQSLGNANPLIAPILTAPSTAYSYNSKDEAEAAEEPFATGSQLSLVSTMQARNSARFTVLGSAETLQDTWFDAGVKLPEGKKEKSGNRDFARRLSAWTFKELGVLKVGKLQHYLNEPVRMKSMRGVQVPVNDSSVTVAEINPSIYRIKNTVVCSHFEENLGRRNADINDSQTYSVELSEYSYDHWVPFNIPMGDSLQLEFTMLNPYHRLSLEPSTYQPNPQNSTVFTTTLQLPDQHGIFNFRLNYKRPFLSYVDEKRTVTVRHFAHDEYPRSYAISGAYVWMLGIGATIVGWCWFVCVWLWSAPSEEELRRAKKAQ
ncbi:MAG: hypothetical protein Q9162_003030 [Coniocarpon cinnabarinum]